MSAHWFRRRESIRDRATLVLNESPADLLTTARALSAAHHTCDRLLSRAEVAETAEGLARRELAKALRDVADLRAARDAAVREHLTADRHEQQARRERDEARDRAGDLLSRLHAIAGALDAAGCPVPDGAREDVAVDRVRALLADRAPKPPAVGDVLEAPESPPGVTTVTDCDGDSWTLTPQGWSLLGDGLGRPWWVVMAHAPLTVAAVADAERLGVPVVDRGADTTSGAGS